MTPRPCVWISCRYHLAIDMRGSSGLRLLRPTMEEDEVVEVLTSLSPEESCALDVTERGGVDLGGVADILGLSRQRVHQLEVLGQRKLKVGLARLGVREEDVDD